MASSRISGIDALRLIGAILVVTLHVSPMTRLQPLIAVEFRLLARWAVPFFCLALGYFAQSGPVTERRMMHTLARIVVITTVASLIYFVVVALTQGLRAMAYDFMSDRFFVEGAYWHLWFLNAAILGIILVATTQLCGAFRYAFWLVAGGLAIGMSCDLLFCFNKIGIEPMNVARLISGTVVVLAGAALRTLPRMPRLGFGIICSFVGLALTLAQGILLLHLGAAALESQLPLGAFVLGFGLFIVGLNVPESKWLEKAGQWGSSFALGLYLFHPIFIIVFTKIAHLSNWPVFPEYIWAGTTTLTMIALVLTSRFLPRIKLLLDGRIQLKTLG